MGDREIGVPVAQDTVLKAFESALEVRRAGCEPPPCPQPTCPATLDRGLRPSAKTTGTVPIELLCWRRKLPGPFLPDCATIRHTGAPGVPQVAQNGVRRVGQVQVIVEGITASGKTTVVELLTERLGLQRIGDEFRTQYTLLERYGRDQRWAFPMQLNFLTTRFAQYLMASESQNFILDRSIFGDMIYADTYHKLHYFSEGQYQMYVQLFDFLSSYLVMPRVFIWTTCSFDTMLQRMGKSPSTPEIGAGETFWEQLHAVYSQFISNLPRNKRMRSYMVLDTDARNLVSDVAARDQFVEEVRQSVAQSAGGN